MKKESKHKNSIETMRENKVIRFKKKRQKVRLPLPKVSLTTRKSHQTIIFKPLLTI